MDRISSAKLFDESSLFLQGVRAGNLTFVATDARGPDGSIPDAGDSGNQARQTLENLRTALWVREQFPRAKVIARSSKESSFATEVGEEHDIISISITQLVEDNIPQDWLEPV